MKIIRHIFIAIVMFLASFQINAKIKLPALFSDNMMLQQKSNAPMWGWADNECKCYYKNILECKNL